MALRDHNNPPVSFVYINLQVITYFRQLRLTLRLNSFSVLCANSHLFPGSSSFRKTHGYFHFPCTALKIIIPAWEYNCTFGQFFFPLQNTESNYSRVGGIIAERSVSISMHASMYFFAHVSTLLFTALNLNWWPNKLDARIGPLNQVLLFSWPRNLIGKGGPGNPYLIISCFIRPTNLIGKLVLGSLFRYQVSWPKNWISLYHETKKLD